MPTTPEPTAAQEALRVGSMALVLLGGSVVASGLGVLKPRRGRQPPKPSSVRLAIGVVMLVGGIGAMALRRHPVPEPEIVSAERFSSRELPALSMVAPPPWRFEHDQSAGRLAGLRPGGRMMIETTYITDSNDSNAALTAVFGNLQRMGLEPKGEPFAQTFDGLRALGRV